MICSPVNQGQTEEICYFPDNQKDIKVKGGWYVFLKLHIYNQYADDSKYVENLCSWCSDGCSNIEARCGRCRCRCTSNLSPAGLLSLSTRNRFLLEGKYTLSGKKYISAGTNIQSPMKRNTFFSEIWNTLSFENKYIFAGREINSFSKKIKIMKWYEV